MTATGGTKGDRITASVRMAMGVLLAVGLAASSAAQSDQGHQSTVALDLPLVHDVGGYTLTDTSGSGAVKLSGIGYAGGSTFYAVGGPGAKLYTLKIDIDLDTGAIRSAHIEGRSLQLKDEFGSALQGADLEGIALAGSSVYVVDEEGPRLGHYELKTGKRLAYVTTTSTSQLNVYSHAVPNRSWESLTRAGDGSAIWTANEEALGVDGGLATTSAGTTVRLQRFNTDLKPTGQWAYMTDPIHGKSGRRFDRAGVVDLLALDDGRLVVMERSIGNGFRIQLYLVRLTGATDVSARSVNDGLRGKPFTPVSKVKLFTKDFVSKEKVNSYFVGITLGPTLRDGGRSLILIADNGGRLNYLVPKNQHRLYALKISL